MQITILLVVGLSVDHLEEFWQTAHIVEHQRRQRHEVATKISTIVSIISLDSSLIKEAYQICETVILKLELGSRAHDESICK